MKKNSTIKRTAIALDPDLTRRIKKVLKGRKLSKYTQDAIRKEIEVDEMEETKRILKQLTNTDQYHKIKQLENSIEKLKDLTDNELHLLGLRIDKYERNEERHYKESKHIIDSRTETYKEAIALLKTAKKNPIIRKELEKH